MANKISDISEPRTVQNIRENPNRLAFVYSEAIRGNLYTHGHCDGNEVVEYIDTLLEKIKILES